jgi:hypothetical protein
VADVADVAVEFRFLHRAVTGARGEWRAAICWWRARWEESKERAFDETARKTAPVTATRLRSILYTKERRW